MLSPTDFAGTGRHQVPISYLSLVDGAIHGITGFTKEGNMLKKRKFTAYLLTLVISSIVCACGPLDGVDYADLMKAAIWAFVVGNGAEHFAGKGK